MDDMVARPETDSGAHKIATHPLDSLTADEISAHRKFMGGQEQIG